MYQRTRSLQDKFEMLQDKVNPWLCMDPAYVSKTYERTHKQCIHNDDDDDNGDKEGRRV